MVDLRENDAACDDIRHRWPQILPGGIKTLSLDYVTVILTEQCGHLQQSWRPADGDMELKMTVD